MRSRGARTPRAGARLRGVQAWLDAHLADPSLTPGRIAGANFISVRSLHRLFEAEGVTVSAWVRDRRLEACRRDLTDPTQADADGRRDRTTVGLDRRGGLQPPVPRGVRLLAERATR